MIINGRDHPVEDDTDSDQREQTIQYFMLNKLCVDLFDNAFQQMLGGFFQVRYAALEFISKMIINIASSLKR